jgi:hypothetical protein
MKAIYINLVQRWTNNELKKQNQSKTNTKMKHYFAYILFCLLTITLSSFGNGKPIITFEKKVCYFGKIKYKPNSILKIKFYYKNSGTAPLVINNVIASCGCTIPNWTTKPISSGTRDYITALFKMKGKVGLVQKKLYVYTNADEKEIILQFNGEIL